MSIIREIDTGFEHATIPPKEFKHDPVILEFDVRGSISTPLYWIFKFYVATVNFI